MNQNYIKITAYIILLLLPCVAFSQGDIIFSANLVHQDLKVFMLSDFNFSGRSTATIDIFRININNTYNETVQCVLSLNISSETFGNLASGYTNPFTLEPSGFLMLTNRNLFNKADEFGLEDYNIENAGQDILDQLLATGQLPSGIYRFDFALQIQRQNGVPEVKQAFFIIDVTNPRTLDLISPGSHAGSSTLPTHYTNFPLFRWESNLDAFRLLIAEKLKDTQDDLSPEEVIQQRTIFDKLLKKQGTVASSFPGAEDIFGTSYQYPVAGVRPLEEGKTYYWQIIGLVQSSGGALEFPSEIWGFVIADMGLNQVLTAEQQQILNLVLDFSTDLFGPGGPLYGFFPTGQATKNGVPLDSDELFDLLYKLSQGEIITKDILVE